MSSYYVGTREGIEDVHSATVVKLHRNGSLELRNGGLFTDHVITFGSGFWTYYYKEDI
jgi:hypothetical protein